MLKARLLANSITSKLVLLLTVFSSLIAFAMMGGLYLRARPILSIKPFWQIVTSSVWKPMSGEFGLFPFIMGTLWVTALSLLIAVPLSLLAATYLSEYAHRRTRECAKPLIDLLAGIPSVVYGVWGVLVAVPIVKEYVAPALGVYSSGYCVLSGGFVLAIMITPIIIHISLEVFRAVPTGARDAALALGATRWQAVKGVVYRKSIPGIAAAVVLGLSRAFGETIAVLMVVGNVPRAPSSLLDPAYPLTALVANNYGEMMSVPLYDSALMLACLVLMIVVLLFNVASRAVLQRVERSAR